MSINKCFITGDVHGNLDLYKIEEWAKSHTNLTKDDYLIILGDFGAVWSGDNRDKELLDWWENQKWTTLFVDG